MIRLRRGSRPGLVVAALSIAAPAAAQSLALERVLLSTGGVAYLEREVRLAGTATLRLPVRLDQVDDVLKSLVVYAESGRVASVSLAGRRPLARLFDALPFDRAALSSPVRLLNALQGAEVEAAGPQTVRGRIVRATPETVRLPDGAGTTTRHRLTLMTAQGLQQVVYEDVRSLRFLDPTLAGQIERALTATAAYRVRGRRTLEIRSVGSQPRTVRVGYVVAAPLWKATYRLTGGDGDRAYLQGWAVIENMSGVDWSDVALTLASGDPVTFRQALYESYYVERPSVPVRSGGRALPRPDEGGVPDGSPDTERAVPPRARALQENAAAARPAPLLKAAPGPAAPEGTARAEQAASQVVFRFPDPVSLESGRSAMLPIVSRDVPARAVALYQPERDARHPFAAIEIENDAGTALPPGVVARYRTAPEGRVDYVGDAELRALPAGERRLLAFARDGSVRIDRETGRRRELVSIGLAGDGVLRQTYTRWKRTGYRIAAPEGDARDLLIAHPRTAGWTLEPPRGVTVTRLPDRYRLRIGLDPDGSTVLTVAEKKPVVERVRVGDLPLDRIEAYARDGSLDETLRATFARLAALRRAVEDAQREVARLERERDEIVADQKRVRSNLARVPAQSDLHGRYLALLSQQEDRLAALRGALAEARAGERKARAALGDYIATL